MRRIFVSLLTFIAFVAMTVVSCDKIDDIEKVSRDLDEYIHSESGSAKLVGFQFGTFYTSDDVIKHQEAYKGSYTFIAFKDKLMFDEIKKTIDYDLPVSFADSTNTLEIMSGESYEDAREKQLSRVVEVFIKTDPMDARYDYIKLESSDSTLVRPEMISAKHYRLFLYDVGQATLTVTVASGDFLERTDYPMTVFCNPVITFNAHSFWVYEDVEAKDGYLGTQPRQLYTVSCSVTELPLNYKNLPYLSKMRMKVHRKCEYKNEVESGNKKFTKSDVIEIKPTQFVDQLAFGRTHSILCIGTGDYAPSYEYGYNYMTVHKDGAKDTVQLVKQAFPYTIEKVDLTFDATAFSPFFDFDGEVGEQAVHVFNNGSLADSTRRKELEDLIKKMNGFKDFEIDPKAFDANEAEKDILNLQFNEFMTDKQLDSLRHVQKESFDSHGWTEAQVDSIWRANQAKIQ